MKVVIPEGALEQIPEDEREALKEELAKLFEDFDPENPPGKLVLRLQDNETECPECGGALKIEHQTTIEDELTEFVFCESCDLVFSRRVAVVS